MTATNLIFSYVFRFKFHKEQIAWFPDGFTNEYKASGKEMWKEVSTSKNEFIWILTVWRL